MVSRIYRDSLRVQGNTDWHLQRMYVLCQQKTETETLREKERQRGREVGESALFERPNLEHRQQGNLTLASAKL